MNHPKAPIILLLLLLGLYTMWAGFRAGMRPREASRPGSYYTIRFDPDIFFNSDSLAYYAKLAYLEEDPDALGITGTAAFIFDGDRAAHDSLPLITTDEGAIMLLRACELGSEDARWVITVLHHHRLWHWSLPE